jgi:antitoxin component YwqK of YwqJK toxin-antitoxin module
MRKVILIIILLIPGLKFIAQESDIDPNGYNIFYYPNSQKSSEGYMEDGKPNGYWMNYYPTGIIRSEGKRTNYELDSIWNFFDEKGNISKNISYKDGLKHGYYSQYKLNKTKDTVINILIFKELYYNNNKNGISEYYNKITGILKLTTPYKNDKKHGITKEYSADGRIITLYEYFNGFLIESDIVNRRNSNNEKIGKWVEFYSGGQPKIEAYYLANQLHGNYIEYSKSGNITKELRYWHGKIVIATEEARKIKAKLKQSYWPDGTLKYEGAFKDSIPVGLHKRFDKDGKISKAIEYDKFGKLSADGSLSETGLKDSTWTFYYDDGTTRSKGAFKNGKRNGQWKFYFQNGKIEQTGKYSTGKINQKWTWYYPNGNVLKTENYHKGKLEGLYIELSPIGDTIQKGEYYDGDKQGEWYHNVGDHTEIGSYDLGMKTGIWKHYINEEKLVFQGKYVDNEPDGLHEWWYVDGNSKLRGKFVMGTKEGIWQKYHADGNIFLVYKYKNGELIKINGQRWDKWEEKIKSTD